MLRNRAAAAHIANLAARHGISIPPPKADPEPPSRPSDPQSPPEPPPSSKSPP